MQVTVNPVYTSNTGLGEFTLAWNEVFNNFPSFHSTKPHIYIELDGNRLISEDPQSPHGLYLHYVNPLHLVFYAQSNSETPVPATAHVIYCVNRDNRISKVPNALSLDASRIFERIQIISGDYFDVAGNVNRVRGGWDLLPESPSGLQALTFLFKPRQGRWFGPAPIAKDLYVEGVGWVNNSIATPITSEHFFVKIVAESTDVSEIASIDTSFTVSKRNS